MSFHTPGKIEHNFRSELGQVNPYMCIIDSAIRDVSKKTYIEIDNINKNYGHRNIYLEHLDLNKLIYFVNMSHIAYINSRAESACTQIMELREMNKIHKNVDIGDFLRQTIFVVHRSKNNIPELKTTKNYKFENDISENILNSYIAKEELLIIDYYRKLRNNTLHHNQNSITVASHFQKSEILSIEKKFNYIPNDIQNMNENDIYILSLAWQYAIKSICKSCINISDKLIPMLKNKYKNKSTIRAKNGIEQLLKQEYLLNPEEINDIIKKVVS